MAIGKSERGQFPTGLVSNNFDTGAELMAEALLNRITDLVQGDGGIFIDSIEDTGLKVIDAGGAKVSVKAGVAHDKFGQRIVLDTDDVKSGEYVSTVDLSADVDLSTNHLININIDGAGAVEIDVQGATPASTTLDEIVDLINAAGFGTIAFRADSDGNPIETGSYVLIKSTTQGLPSILEFTAPSATDATFEIFGLSEAAYPHTYLGGGGYDIPVGGATYNVVIEYIPVEENVGNFEAGYPAASDTEYMELRDSYRISVTLDDPISDATQHEIRLAQVVNNTGTLTITDRRGDSIVALQGTRGNDSTPPLSPEKIFLTTSQIGSSYGIDVKWSKVTDPSGIKKYIIEKTLTHVDGTLLEVPVISYDNYENTLDTTELTYQLRIETVSQGEQYTVKVAAQDNSLSQNISSFTDFGNVIIGQLTEDDNETPVTLQPMPATTNDPINNGVRVDWGEVEQAEEYEYCYAFGGLEPQWNKSPTFKTSNSEVSIPASPGDTVKSKVRAIFPDKTKSKDVIGKTIAGGTIIGKNEKVFDKQDLSVNASDESKTQRFLAYLKIPNPANIVDLSVYVTSLVLGTAEKGSIRIYKENAEADAVSITFAEDGRAELPIDDFSVEAGWLVIDAWDTNESGTNQAAFVVNVFVTYAEGIIRTGATKGVSGDNIGL